MATEAPVLARPLVLHVSGLDATTSEVDLYQFISETQVPVQSIRIIRNEATKAPRYAYVNFSSVEDAEKVLNTLNYKKFKDNEIYFSHSIPQSHRNPLANLHIANLPADTSSEVLSNSFSVFGAIVSARVGVSKEGVRHTYGYVQFQTAEAAASSIEAVEKGPITIAGIQSNVTISVFKPAPERIRKQTNVFVRNFPVAKGQDHFIEVVSKFGAVTSHYFMSNCLNIQKTGPSETGYGFVNYETPEQADNAIQELNKLKVDGFDLQSFFSKSKPDRQRELADKSRSFSLIQANLYVKHIDPSLSEDALQQFFRAIGEVISFKLVVNEMGSRTGVAFVQYKSPEDAQSAIRQANQRQWYASIFQTKAQRDAAGRYPRNNNFNQYNNGGNRPRQYYQQQPHQQQGYPMNRMYQQPRHSNYGMYNQPRFNNGPRNHRHGGRKFNQQNSQAARLSPEEQRQKLGEELYWKVEQIDKAQAPQITGMLLDMPVDEIYSILKEGSLLRDKVKEAQELLNATPQ